MPLDQPSGSNLTEATWLELYDLALDAKAEITSAQGKYRNILKRAKDAGVNLVAFKAWLADAAKTADQRETNTRDYLMYAGWLGKPINFQAAFDFAPDESAAAKKARAKHTKNEIKHNGMTAGRGGEPIDNDPHEAGSEESQIWRMGWFEGQNQSVAGLTEGSSRPRRGRKPATPAEDDGDGEEE